MKHSRLLLRAFRKEPDRNLPCFSEVSKHSTTTAKEPVPKPFESIPKPRSLPLIGHLHLFSKFGPYSLDRIYDAYSDLHRLYGPVVRLDLGISMVLLFRPEDVQTLFGMGEKYPQRPLFEALRTYRLSRKDAYSCAGLTSENGVEWHRLRFAANFMMRPQFVGSFLQVQAEVAEDFVSRIPCVQDSEGCVPDFLHELYRYTQEAIGVVCFGVRLGLLEESQSEFSKQLSSASHDMMQSLADTLLGLPWWKIMHTSAYKKLVQSQDFFNRFATECAERAEKKLRDPDNKEDSSLDFFRKLIGNDQLKSNDTGLLMTEIFAAGIDATGNTIGFLLYNLTRNPNVQEKLYEEIRNHTKDGQLLSVETLSTMKYLKACMKESYRLSPTSGGNARILSSPGLFSGYQVPANVLCIGVNPIICQQEAYFQDPLEFIPERWLDEKTVKNIHPYSVVPFGHGVRRCIGQRFAEQEIKLLIIKIIEKYRVKYDGPDIGFKMRMLLIPDKPLNFTFTKR